MSGPTALARSRHELAELLRGRGEHPLALVPTMGALHEGHASLVRAARQRTPYGPVVASVFVNPLQFGPGEDLDRYPRTLEADLDLCRAEGVDVVFAPAADEVYPGSGDGPSTPQVTVHPGPLGEVLEGATRPGHFAGVLTVVAKLFGLVRPDLAVFGEKDYQQLVLVRRMVSDLCLGVRVHGAPTRRDPDGLALSSRNRYLDASQRGDALALSAALRAAQRRAGTPAEAEDAARAVLDAAPGVRLDYLAVTDPELGPLPAHPPPGTPGRVLVAARVGQTRLIDNAALELGRRQDRGATAQR